MEKLLTCVLVVNQMINSSLNIRIKMKLYIYIWVFLLMGCAGSSQRKVANDGQDFENDMPAIQQQSEDAKSVESDKQVEQQNFEKRIQKSSGENDASTDVITDKNFDAIGRQKLQEAIDISYLVFDDKTQTEMKDYALKHAHRLFVQKKQPLLLQQLKKCYVKSADSARISDLKLQKLDEVSANEQVAFYRFTLRSFFNGKPSKPEVKQAKIYFEIVDLNLDGKVYKTIKSKILSVE